MILSDFLKQYRNRVESATGKSFSGNKMAVLLGVDYFRYNKWEQGKGMPKDEKDRLAIKMFFGIDNLDEIKEDVLNLSVDRHPEPFAKLEDLAAQKSHTIPLGQQNENQQPVKGVNNGDNKKTGDKSGDNQLDKLDSSFTKDENDMLAKHLFEMLRSKDEQIARKDEQINRKDEHMSRLILLLEEKYLGGQQSKKAGGA